MQGRGEYFFWFFGGVSYWRFGCGCGCGRGRGRGCGCGYGGERGCM